MPIWSIKNLLSRKEATHQIGQDPESDINLLVRETLNNMPGADENKIRKAFRWCLDAHKDQMRKSGDPFYTHPLSVARIIANEIPIDDNTVVVALLHDIIDGSEVYTLDSIKAEFGSDVCDIVADLNKIRLLENGHKERLSSYKQLLLSLMKDARVILVKIADRLHNLRTLEYLNPERQRQAALEALEFYAPFAHRFGLGHLKWELEDLGFKFLNPEAYEDIKNSLKSSRDEREEYIKKTIAQIKDKVSHVDIIKKDKIPFEVYGRPKHIYSIFNKMRVQDKRIDELYDLFAIRVIIDTPKAEVCNIIFDSLCEIYRPIMELYNDYVSNPKPNGYQSLHSTFIGLDNHNVEVQIRTRTMHEVAEKGVAAHFRYKESQREGSWLPDDKRLEDWSNWMRRVFERSKDKAAIAASSESFKLDIFQGEIYVFTPKNEMRILPNYATPLDFAFDIHSEVGLHCIGAKVNGKVSPLNYRLQSGDLVEIITSKHKTLSDDWLLFVVTNKARAAIQKHLQVTAKRQILSGEKIWNENLKAANLFSLKDKIFKDIVSSDFKQIEDFYKSIAKFEIEPNHIFQAYYDSEKANAAKKPIKQSRRKTINGIYANESKTVDFSDVVFADCCSPIAGDPIIASLRMDGVLEVHLLNCNNINDSSIINKNSLVNVAWSEDVDMDFVSFVRIKGVDRSGMLNDITMAILNCDNANIRSVNIESHDTTFDGAVGVIVRNVEHLARVINKIYAIEGVKKAERREFFE